MRHIRLYIERWFITKFISFILNIISSAAVFTVCCYAVKDGVFENYDATKTALFAILMSLIWSGLFDTIGQFNSEANYTLDHFNKSLPLYAYLFGTIFVEWILSMVQALASVTIFYAFFDFSSKGLIFPNIFFDYLITFFLIIFSANLTGLAIGTFVSSMNTALTVIPAYLIIQMLLSGCLFDLADELSKIANFTTAKFGFSALGSLANLNSPKLPLKINEVYPMVVKVSNHLFDYNADYILECWMYLGIITLMAFMIAYVSLHIRINKKR